MHARANRGDIARLSYRPRISQSPKFGLRFNGDFFRLGPAPLPQATTPDFLIDV
jgi:hypothetical protein